MFSKSNKSPKQHPPAQDPVRPQTRTGGSGVPSIISADLRVVGDLISEGDVQIEGVVEGDVKSKSLTIGENALIKGSVISDSVRIRGTVDGEIFSRSVLLAKSSRVRGDITHESIAIEAGAYLDGRCRRLEEGQEELRSLTASSHAGLLTGQTETETEKE